MLTPCDDADLRAEMCQRSMHACDQDATLEAEVEQALTCLFEKEIAFNRVFEELKQRMASTKTFSLQLAFSLIDDW